MLLIDDNILIVHMKKCGGTAFCRGIIDNLPPERVQYFGYNEEGEQRSAKSARAGGVWKHSTTDEILQKLKIPKDDLARVILLSDRPFWERTASFYLHAKRHNQRDPLKYSWAKDIGFTEYLRCEHADFEKIPEFACGENGEALVTEIVSFDKIDQSFSSLCEDIGIAEVKMPVLNASPLSVDYRLFYSREDWDLICNEYKVEIDFLTNYGIPVDTSWMDVSAANYRSQNTPKVFEPPANAKTRQKLGDLDIVAPRLKLHAQSTLESPLKLVAQINVDHPIHVGAYTFITRASLSNCSIGRYCSVSERAVIGYLAREQKYLTKSAWVHTAISSGTHRHLRVDKNPQRSAPCVLGNDVSVGYGAIIAAGVHIGDGAEIQPYSYVVEDVPKYAVVAGAPAEIVAYRFDETHSDPEQVRADLLDLKWWNRVVSKNLKEKDIENFKSFSEVVRKSPPIKSHAYRTWELSCILVDVMPPHLITD